jgi:uncharacterized membrane protein YeiH
MVMSLQYVCEHAAIALFAATGGLAARGKSVDLFGVLVLGLVTATGGGTLRDLILDVPVYWVRDSSFLITGTLAALTAFVIVRFVPPPRQTLMFVDAFALAFVTMLGTAKTQHLGHPAPVCVLLGVMTGVAGGMCRDLMCGEIPLILRSHVYLYATAAMAGAIVFLILSKNVDNRMICMACGAGMIIALRFAALRWKWRLPVFESSEDRRQAEANRPQAG